jgi:hypothetical protein
VQVNRVMRIGRGRCRAVWLLPFAAAAVHRRHGTDHLLANEAQRGRSGSLMQVTDLVRSDEVDAVRRGCCTLLLHRLDLPDAAVGLCYCSGRAVLSRGRCA